MTAASWVAWAILWVLLTSCLHGLGSGARAGFTWARAKRNARRVHTEAVAAQRNTPRVNVRRVAR